MKRKLRIEELSVTSFSTDDAARERGTVRGHGDVSYGTCPGEATCDSCDLRTCADTCGDSCTCQVTCFERTCYFTCFYASCPDRETECEDETCRFPC